MPNCRNCDKETPAPLCQECCYEVERCRNEIPSLVQALSAFVAAGSTEMGVRSSRRSCPLDLRVDELRREAQSVLFHVGPGQINAIAEEPPRAFTVWSDGVYTEAQLSGVQRLLAVLRVHSKLVEFVGLHPHKQRRYAPCLKCNNTSLFNWAGGGDILCENCDWVIGIDDYQAYCAELIERGTTW